MYFARELRVGIPANMDAQIRSLAQRHEMTVSDLTRQVLALTLKQNGFDPPPIARTPSERRQESGRC